MRFALLAVFLLAVDVRAQVSMDSDSKPQGGGPAQSTSPFPPRPSEAQAPAIPPSGPAAMPAGSPSAGMPMVAPPASEPALPSAAPPMALPAAAPAAAEQTPKAPALRRRRRLRRRGVAAPDTDASKRAKSEPLPVAPLSPVSPAYP